MDFDGPSIPISGPVLDAAKILLIDDPQANAKYSCYEQQNAVLFPVIYYDIIKAENMMYKSHS